MKEKGVSPIIATILLVALTVAASTPIVWWLATYYAPFRPRFVDLAVYAGFINENIVRFHIQHVGGETIRFRTDEPTTAEIRGWATDALGWRENELYCWTFENPLRFRQGDWAYAEIQMEDAGFDEGLSTRVRLWSARAGLLYEGEVTINSMAEIPGG
jgi:flagellin-like protein